MSSFGHTDNNDDIAESGTTFLDLPNEITTKIFEALSLEDRASLAATNERLNELERKTGHRRFERIMFGSRRGLMYFETGDDRNLDKKKHLKIYPDDLAEIEDISSYLNHAIVEQLWIQGSMVTEKNLSLAFKTVKFQELIVFMDDYSGRIVSELVKGRKGIRKLSICWGSLGKNAEEEAKNMLADLPPINEYRLSTHYQTRIIDDEILLHLVRNSQRAYLDGETTVTARGLASAFEIVCRSKKEKVVKVSVYTTVVNGLIRSLDPEQFKDVSRREIYSTREITHRKSEAKLSCVADLSSIIYSDVTMTSTYNHRRWSTDRLWF